MRKYQITFSDGTIRSLTLADSVTVDETWVRFWNGNMLERAIRTSLIDAVIDVPFDPDEYVVDYKLAHV